MATWTTIPDSSLEPGKPIRSIDAIALRDNPVAIAEGAPGAPKIEAQALDTTTDERDWVLARTANASVGAVGTYAFLGSTNTTATTPGLTKAGSSLRYAGIYRSNSTWNGGTTNSVGSKAVTTAPAGTWMCMGHDGSSPVSGEDSAHYGATLWLRIA
jgi:hypothetical protein